MNIEEIAEEYRDVDGFNGYKVSNFGNLKNKKGKILKFREDKDGYKRTNLYKDNKPHTFRIHTLVAKAFIANPENKNVIDHIDRNHQNNHISNLRWATISENTINSATKKRTKLNIRGVYFDESRNKYNTRICKNGKSIYGGSFEKIEDAIEKRKELEQLYFGEFTPVSK